MSQPVDQRCRSLEVAQIPEAELDRGHIAVPGERTDVTARVVAQEGAHIGALGDQAVDEMAADEAARARHRDSLAAQ